MGYVGTGTQLDGLGHIGVDNVYYNCNKNSDFVQANGLTKLGIEKIPPFVTRGVVLDMTALLRPGPVLEKAPPSIARRSTSGAPSAGRRDPQGRRRPVPHRLAARSSARTTSASSPASRASARRVRCTWPSKEVVAVGADTWGLEVIPFEQGVGVFEVHQILIPRNGIYILENINTAELVKDKAWEFMFVLGHSRITGGVQAIINPVAIR